MPAIGARGGIQRGATLPGARTPNPPVSAQPTGLLGGIGAAIGNIGGAVHHATVSASTPHRAPQAGTDVQTGGYNFARANAYKQTPAYHNAVAQVFQAQPIQQRAAIIQGLVRNNAFNTQEYHAIRSVWDHLPTSEMSATASLIPHDIAKFISPKPGLSLPNLIESGLQSAGHGLSHLLDFLPSPNNGTPVGAAMQQTAGGATPADVAKNALKDVVNLPAEVGPSVAIPVGQALSGNVKGALNTIAQPYVQAFNNPQQALEQHPVNTYLLAGGPIHGAARIADQGARAITGHPADLQRPAVQLTGNLTRERPNYSKFPLIRHAQKQVEHAYYRPVEGGITPRTEPARLRFVRQGVSQRVGMNERIRRVEVTNQERAHAKAVLAPKAQQVAHGVRTALAYNPEPALIRGAGVLSLIEQGVIRRPETALRDLSQHLTRVKAARDELAGFPEALKQHDQYVSRLSNELKAWKADKNLPRSLGKAFDAAGRYGRDYRPLEAQAHKFGHFAKGVTRENLDRRSLGAIVHEHFPGARFDPERQTMMVDTPHGSRVLSTKEMRDFAAKETGGRPIAYASHQAPRGDSAFFVSSQKFPARAIQRNSYFALRHGLIDPSHEALLHGRVHMQGVVSAHQSMGRLLGLLTEKNGQGYWRTHAEAKRDAPAGYVPINVGRAHGHGLEPGPSDAVHASDIETEALRHSLDLNSRLQPTDEVGKWALIHKTAIDQLRKHENQISPNALLRGFRGTTGQFRKVALGTSAKHIPGVIQENLLRDIASGVFVHHWVAERSVYREAAKINPELAAQRRIEQTGGQVSGATRALATRQVSRHFSGTALEGPLKGFEAFMRAPGPRQLSTAWNAWLRFAIDGTKHYLEETHQRAAVGKQLLNDFGGLMRLQGDAAREAAVHGYLPEQSARRLRAGTERMFGKWTDLSPEVQTALMVSPFGMWWANSVKWLARLPVDHPVGTSLLAAANLGTEKQRQALGLDMFAPNHLPLYEQGGIPSGGSIVAQNYYSPFGVANDPMETAQSLILPTLTPQVLASLGDNWLGREMKSPKHPRGGATNSGQRAAVIVNSILGMLVPLYQKAQTIVQGGGSAFDTSTLFAPQTKAANEGLGAGLAKAFTPVRKYKNVGNKGAAPSTGWGGGSSSGASPSGGGSGGGWGQGGGSSGGGGSTGSGGWG